ncbi:MULTISPECIES: ROK family transcriptional regulator [Paenibacillus]|uniref:ROK family protein n=1 Tax=Paenibacillus naphthalenovorans TaxID=162209 RepID=A0A0U2MXS1_9BACL|nr:MULTISPECIES: ROK family transcriptional regulator [Paenibacillus]ALS23007.1 ROK family protein [Paenibacillus naphthalenovorans]GCL71932.1 ROK family transcriptional regulator [Paenibacillus naphthalenovorans]SDI42905.1 Sugar kinase of the NBD/HSP70 family, may contain an N-terminal HTH domain [Paenibacillus naphthalenovorans]
MLIISRKTDIKQSNKLSILQWVRNSGETTQPEISKELGLSRPTVSALVEELILEGYIKVSGMGSSTDQGGKRPKLIAFHARGGGILALYFTVNTIKAALMDLSANLLHELRVSITPKDTTETMLAKVKDLAGALLLKAKELGIPVKGIGVGCPGLVETSTGTILTSTHLEVLNGCSLGESLSSAFHLPVWVDNECRNQVLAEKMFGEGQDVDTFVSLMTDVGIGAGIIIDNRIMRGKDDSFGEIGHTTIQMDGLKCRCGNDGCWEMYASSNSLMSRIHENLSRTLLLKDMVQTRDELTFELIGEAIRRGDDVVYQLAIEDLGKYLGIGIANLVNSINPELIIIHGEMIHLGERLITEIEKQIQQRALPVPKERVRVIFSKLGPKANLIGSCALVLKELFDNPELLFQVNL